jgi:hypothetical protein
MKTYLQCASFALLFVAFSACQSDPFGLMPNELNRELTTLDETNNQSKTTKHSASDSLSTFLKTLAPIVETFVFNGEKGSVFTTTKGTKLHLSNAVFINEKGEMVKDNIRLTIQELHTPSDMLLADKPTNVNLKNGYLESFGEFKITANHDGKPLQLQAGSSINIETEVANNGKRQVPKMPVWNADTNDITQQTKGLNHLAEPTIVTQFFRQKKGAIWAETPQRAEINALNRLQFDLTNLNKWKNCDIFREDTTQKTTVLCHFGENLAPTVFDGETANQAAAVYFKPLNINALIKFYQPILNAPINKAGFYSEENSLPIGTKGTLIAVSFQNGKLYVDQQNITINAPRNNEKAVFFTLHPVERDPSVFLNNLRLL